jgi:DNA-directed RNA polymerase specialized sigma24 family protein
VTVNRAVDVVRGRRSESGSLDEAAEVGGGDVADRAIDEEALRGDVAAALNRLTDVQRGVLIAKLYDEMTFAQISVEYGISLSTAKTHYLRAVTGVRDRLRRWDDRESAESVR